MAKKAKGGRKKEIDATRTAQDAPPPAIRENMTAQGAPPRAIWNNRVAQAALILLVGAMIYANSLQVPFYFDDIPCIVNNPAIADISLLFDYPRLAQLSVPQDIKHNIVLRPLAYVTFAWNHSRNGFDVMGYHLVNIAIHLVNGLLVLLLAGLTLRAAAMAEAGRDDPARQTNHYLPLFAALLFVVHPLQTQAVTYIAQRFTSLATLFYLAAVVLYATARMAPATDRPRLFPAIRRWSCYLFSVVATVAAMKTKEIAFTLPLTLTLYELLFFTGSLKKRLLLLAPYYLTLPIIPWTVMALASGNHPVNPRAIADPTNLVNFTSTSRWDYLLTQFGVITIYLRLLLLPRGQILDYDYPLAHDPLSLAVLLPFLLLATLCGGALLLWFRTAKKESPYSPLLRLLVFGTLWFFLTLTVESSLIPLTDVIFEHRVYLPATGFFLALLAAMGVVRQKYRETLPSLEKIFVTGLVAATLLLAAATILRNIVWQDPVVFWLDVITKSPGKALAHYTMLADAYRQQGQLDEAIVYYRKRLAAGRDDPQIRNNLAGAYFELGRLDEARREMEAALAADPGDVLSHLNLGALYEQLRQYPQAVTEYSIYLETHDDPGIREKVQAMKEYLKKE